MKLQNDRKIARLVLDAMFLVAGLMLSLAEHLLPLTVILPLPGMKLGLANLAVLFCAWEVGLWDAGCVSLLRCLVTGLLFGSGVSVLFSLSGAALAFFTLVMIRLLLAFPEVKISFAGISLLCAAGHNLGQILCAGVLYGWGMEILRTYGGVLLVTGSFFGFMGGFLLNHVARRLPKKTFFSLDTPHPRM